MLEMADGAASLCFSSGLFETVESAARDFISALLQEENFVLLPSGDAALRGFVAFSFALNLLISALISSLLLDLAAFTDVVALSCDFVVFLSV